MNEEKYTREEIEVALAIVEGWMGGAPLSNDADWLALSAREAAQNHYIACRIHPEKLEVKHLIGVFDPKAPSESVRSFTREELNAAASPWSPIIAWIEEVHKHEEGP